MARIHYDEAGDNDLRIYFQTHKTFSGAEVYIQPISLGTIDSDHEDWDWYEYLRDNRDPRIGIGWRRLLQ